MGQSKPECDPVELLLRVGPQIPDPANIYRKPWLLINKNLIGDRLNKNDRLFLKFIKAQSIPNPQSDRVEQAKPKASPKKLLMKMIDFGNLPDSKWSFNRITKTK